MSSDSSDDENLDLLREATDSQFINDSMFNEKTSNSVIQETTPSNKKPLPSLRKPKDEDEQFNLFHVTPEFRNYIAKHLSKALEEKVQKLLKSVKDANNIHKKRKWKSSVRLFTDSKSFIKVEKNVELSNSDVQLTATAKPRKNPELARRYKEVDADLLRQVAVNPDDILSKKEIKYWSNRSKAPVFHYKKSSDGKLVLIEPEFK